MNIGYHFTGGTLLDGQLVPPIGETLIYPGKIEICRAGYHGSDRPSDALKFAPGPWLHQVTYSGEIQRQDDKWCATERTIVASIDATFLLRRFAADQALSVAHLWDMPPVLLEYLTTLDKSKRAAASAAASAATNAVAWAAASAATWDIASAAASAATNAVAWAAASAAASAATNAATNALASAATWAATRAEFDRRVCVAFANACPLEDTQ